MKKIMLASLLLYGTVAHAAQANKEPHHFRFVRSMVRVTGLPIPLLNLIVCLATPERYRDVTQVISDHMPTKQFHAMHGLSTPEPNWVAMHADLIDMAPEHRGQINYCHLTFQLDDPETPGYPVFRRCTPAEKSPLPESLKHSLHMGIYVRSDPNFGGFLFSPEYETGDVWKVGWAIAKFQQYETARQEQEAKARAARAAQAAQGAGHLNADARPVAGVKRKHEALSENSGAGISTNQKLLTAPRDEEGDTHMPPVANATTDENTGSGAGAGSGQSTTIRNEHSESNPKKARTS